MTAAPPLLSVVVPTRHRNDLLGRCLERLAPGAQTLPGECYEVIVSDDGVLPTAESIVREHFPWARWTPGPHRGPAANRNHGARQAAGRWLAFTDDDCVPDPGWLENLAARARQPDSPRVLEGRTTAGGLPCGPLETSPTNEDGGFLWSCNLAVERGFFFELGGFDANFPSPHLEDVDLRLRLEDGGHRWEFVPAALVIHPPRPVRPVVPAMRAHESYFYLAAKRRTPLAAVGLSWGVYWRPWVKSLLASRSPVELARVAGRNLAEASLLAIFLPRWHLRYRGRRQRRSGAPAPAVL